MTNEASISNLEESVPLFVLFSFTIFCDCIPYVPATEGDNRHYGEYHAVIKKGQNKTSVGLRTF